MSQVVPIFSLLIFRDCNELLVVYEASGDETGKKMTLEKIEEIQKEIQDLKRKRQSLQKMMPPRPLPQVRFVPKKLSKEEEKTDVSPFSKPPELIVPDFFQTPLPAIENNPKEVRYFSLEKLSL